MELPLDISLHLWPELCGALQNKAHVLAGMETLAFIVLPASMCIYSKLKRLCPQSRVYIEVGCLLRKKDLSQTTNTRRQDRSKLKLGI